MSWLRQMHTVIRRKLLKIDIIPTGAMETAAPVPRIMDIGMAVGTTVMGTREAVSVVAPAVTQDERIETDWRSYEKESG